MSEYNIPDRYNINEDNKICKDMLNSISESSKFYKNFFDDFKKSVFHPQVKQKQKKIEENLNNFDLTYNRFIKDIYNYIQSLFISINDHYDISYLNKDIRIIIHNLNNGYGDRYIRIENISASIGFLLLFSQILSIYFMNFQESISFPDKSK